MKMNKITTLTSALFLSTLISSCTDTASTANNAQKSEPAAASSQPMPKPVAAVSSLTSTDVKVGDGAEAKTGQTVSVHYTGWLYDPKAADQHGTQFDSSRTRGTAFKFPLGAGRVIKGWDQGVAGMKVGGQRTLIIPPEMAYGARGAGGVIPANATLVFDVELMGVE